MVDSPVSGLDPSAAAVAVLVVRYVRRNPWAADTCNGIARWWLPADAQADPVVVLRALQALVREGTLRARRLPSGDFLYSATASGNSNGNGNGNDSAPRNGN